MSAFICDNETISVIAKGFELYSTRWSGGYRADDYCESNQFICNAAKIRTEIGQSLLNQNYKSVNHRYNENTETPKFKYIDIDIDEGMVYGCIQCYEYQACETEDYYESKLHFSLLRLKDAIIERLLKKAGQKISYGYGCIIE